MSLPPLVPWPIAYGALGPVEKSRIVGNAPRLWSPLTFVGIDVHSKIGVQIHCVGQVIVLPASRPMARGLWPMAYGARVSVKRSRIVRNAPKLLSPSTFVGIDVHVKFGTQIRCVGQVIVAPASRPVARGLWTTRFGQKIEDCSECSETLQSLNICWDRRPCKNWHQNSLSRPSFDVPASRPVARGLWPMDHPFGRKIKVVRNAPKLCRSFLYVLRKDHAKNRLKIHCSD